MMFSLRPIRLDDEGFLFRLYASTRQEEISAWGWNQAQQEAFLHVQYTAQRRWLRYGLRGGRASADPRE